MSFSPQDTARQMIRSLRNAYAGCYWLGSQQEIQVLTITERIEQIRANMDAAHTALQTLQASFTNTVIATKVAEHIEPAPADLPAAYTAARTAVLAMLDDYGANVIPLLPWPYTWNATTRVHDPATYNIDTPTNFKTNIIAARDALEVFA